ncbi:unnamed protein product [Paramecium pentaurelia]|uniref:Transmembrane protein n=1 Tax=Paramecium pentaurelia TaxID=43138 RepID=A0A8S1U6A0_9CILI|nr:unnamed protein product [Paramecium pentaurelia]
MYFLGQQQILKIILLLLVIIKYNQFISLAYLRLKCLQILNREETLQLLLFEIINKTINHILIINPFPPYIINKKQNLQLKLFIQQMILLNITQWIMIILDQLNNAKYYLVKPINNKLTIQCAPLIVRRKDIEDQNIIKNRIQLHIVFVIQLFLIFGLKISTLSFFDNEIESDKINLSYIPNPFKNEKKHIEI